MRPYPELHRLLCTLVTPLLLMGPSFGSAPNWPRYKGGFPTTDEGEAGSPLRACAGLPSLRDWRVAAYACGEWCSRLVLPQNPALI